MLLISSSTDSEETRKNVKCQLNLQYGLEEENIYDIFGIDLDEGE